MFSQENGVHNSFFCSVTSGSGDRPKKEGCHGGGVYSFFPACTLNVNVVCSYETNHAAFQNSGSPVILSSLRKIARRQ